MMSALSMSVYVKHKEHGFCQTFVSVTRTSEEEL